MPTQLKRAQVEFNLVTEVEDVLSFGGVHSHKVPGGGWPIFYNDLVVPDDRCVFVALKEKYRPVKIDRTLTGLPLAERHTKSPRAARLALNYRLCRVRCIN